MITLNSKNFSHAINACSKLIKGNNTLPILDNFKIDIDGNIMHITSSDLENTLIMTVECESTLSTSICVPAKILVDLFNIIPEQGFNIDIKASSIKIITLQGEYDIPILNADEYPKINKATETGCLSINAEKLLSYLSMTLPYTANDELRPVMNGIYIDMKEDTLSFAATNATKLIKIATDVDSSTHKEGIILSKKPASLLISLLSKIKDNVDIQYDDKNMYVELNDAVLISRLVEGRYPNYNGVIPSAYTFALIIDRMSLLGALKRVATVSNKASNLVKLLINNSSIELTTQDIDFSTSAKETIECNSEASNFIIGFKIQFLVEILSGLSCKDIEIQFTDSSKAAIITSGDKEEELKAVCLLMPMILND